MSIPHLTVATIVPHPNAADTYLMVIESSPRGLVINQPAGHVETGETLQQAAIRETLEETAALVKIDGLCGVYNWQNGLHRTYMRICYFGTLIEENVNAILDDGIAEARWMTYDDIKAADNLRSPLVLRCIDDYRAGHRIATEHFYELDEEGNELPEDSSYA